MSKKLDEILLECIEDVKAGSSVDDCLKRYPTLRDELEPLLNIAISLREPSDVRPSPEFKIRARVNLMDHIYTEGPAKSSAAGKVTRPKRMAHPFRLKATTVAITITAAVCGLGGGFAYASQDSLPGDNLYPVKLSTEQIRRVATISNADEAMLELEFASIRLDEMAAVADRGHEQLAIAVDGYEKNINLALEDADKISDAAESADTQDFIALATARHIEVLDSIGDTATEATGNSIQQASGIAFNAHIRALRGLAAENPIRAAELNLATMGSRLNRAQNKAEQNQIAAAETALSQFEELIRLGEEISQMSKGHGNSSNEVDELNARATSAHLEVLGIIYGKMPEQTKGTVEDSMAASVEIYDQAVKGLQEQGVLDDIPEEPPIPETVPGDVKEKILKPEPKTSDNNADESPKGPGNSQH